MFETPVRIWTRIRCLGLVARFTIVGLTVGVLVAGGLAWIIEGRVTDLLEALLSAAPERPVLRAV